MNRPSDIARVRRKGWKVLAEGPRCFVLVGPSDGSPPDGVRLAHLTEESAWRGAIVLEHWEGMERRAPVQPDPFGASAA